MATKRLRPGTWSLVNSGSAERIKIDDDEFIIQGSQTLEFAVRKMATYDDSNIVAYRFPPAPQSVVSNVGDVEIEKESITQKKRLK